MKVSRSIRKDIQMFESAISKIPGAVKGDNKMCPLKHTFADNVYVREIFIPKDTVIVGKIHRHSHPNFLLKGEVTVITEGGGMERIKAPMSIISPAGTKRVLYTHEDTTWVTVHVVGKERNLKKIENIVITKTYKGIRGK
jgi:quercetin dioxygenase-like cupin family protein